MVGIDGEILNGICMSTKKLKSAHRQKDKEQVRSLCSKKKPSLWEKANDEENGVLVKTFCRMSSQSKNY